MSVAERRKFPRLSFNVEIKYEILDRHPLETEEAMGKNISAGGICIIALEKIDVGMLLRLEFFLPDSGKVLTATGKVAWVEEFSVGYTDTHKSYNCGVEFTEINAEDQEEISQYVLKFISPQ